MKVKVLLMGVVIVFLSAAVAVPFAQGYGEAEREEASAMEEAEMSVAAQTMGKMEMMENPKWEIDGYCPVSVMKGASLMQGLGQFVTEYQGKIYKFMGFEQQKMFFQSPEDFINGLKEKYDELKTGKVMEKKGS